MNNKKYILWDNNTSLWVGSIISESNSPYLDQKIIHVKNISEAGEVTEQEAFRYIEEYNDLIMIVSPFCN